MLHIPGILIATAGGVHLPLRLSRMEYHIPSCGEDTAGYWGISLFCEKMVNLITPPAKVATMSPLGFSTIEQAWLKVD